MPRTASLLCSKTSTAGQRPAVAYGDDALTFAELAASCDRLAGRLGVQPGDRVAIVAPNLPALVVGMFAAWQAEAVAVPLSSRLGRFELARAVSDAEPAVMLAAGPERVVAEAQAVASDTPSPPAVLVLDQLGDVVSEHRPDRADATRSEPSGEEIGAILYTSGTSGEPKGVPVPHVLLEGEAHELAQLLGPHADASTVFTVPISHAFGLGCLLGTVAGGGQAVMVEQSTSLRPLLDAIERHRAQVLHSTPSLLARLLRGQAEVTFKTGFTAGSICPPQVLETLDRRGATILNLYGMTEIGAASACSSEDSETVRYHTVGRPLPGYEFRAVDGEIQVRGPFASRYHRRAWAEDETAGDGWFRTGDLGSIDPGGNISISGRSKEVVHVGGFNVFPGEVESYLLTHPSIEQAAAVGTPHPELGEALEAFVVPIHGAELEPREVIRFARAGIAGYKVPYTVHVVDDLPLLPSGKPNRRELSRTIEAQGVAPAERAGAEAPPKRAESVC
jgi:long-chain acyl-CoA synthetase